MDFAAFAERLSSNDFSSSITKFEAVQWSAAEKRAFANAVKGESARLLRQNLALCERLAERLQWLGSEWDTPYVRGIAAQIAGNVALIGRGNAEAALQAYERSERLFAAIGEPLMVAGSRRAKIAVFAQLGRYEEAFAAGEAALSLFEAYERSTHSTGAGYAEMVGVLINLAWVHDRLGDDHKALELLDRAQQISQTQSLNNPGDRAGIALNRAAALRTIGRFSDSITAAETALDLFSQLNLPIERARTLLWQAETAALAGHYSRALTLFDEADVVYAADSRVWDRVQLELQRGRVLLYLGRFAAVLDSAETLLNTLSNIEPRTEIGELWLAMGRAWLGLHQPTRATDFFHRAQTVFQRERNRLQLAWTQLEQANAAVAHGDLDTGQHHFSAATTQFAALGLPVESAETALAAGRAALKQSQPETASVWLSQIEAAILELPPIRQQVEHLLGLIAVSDGKPEKAKHHFSHAIDTLETMGARLPSRYRADFLLNRASVYEDAVELALEMDDVETAFAWVERAKSRSLVEMLAYRLDVTVAAQNAADRPDVDAINRLLAERNRLYRRENGRTDALTAVEKELAALRDRLLLRHAVYRESLAPLHAQVDVAGLQRAIPSDAVVVEYFVANGRLTVFLVTADSIGVEPLAGSLDEVQMLYEFWTLNLSAIAGLPTEFVAASEENARQLLGQLYDLLIRPIRNHLTPFQNLIFVPHNLLHYLPFHALHDGISYLVETFRISTVPTLSVLPFCKPRSGATGATVIGFSENGLLPHVSAEAQTIARLLQTAACIDQNATRQAVARAAQSSILHLATHGDFRADNPLFSGLSLADGALTTLDIFDLRLSASLVTLSACQTGLHVIGGGDELFGLTRAFLYAGAASLVLSLWQVDDAATADLMTVFYEQLLAGSTKAESLRQAQLAMLHSKQKRHPFYWAAFALVGHMGAIAIRNGGV